MSLPFTTPVLYPALFSSARQGGQAVMFVLSSIYTVVRTLACTELCHVMWDGVSGFVIGGAEVTILETKQPISAYGMRSSVGGARFVGSIACMGGFLVSQNGARFVHLRTDYCCPSKFLYFNLRYVF